MWCTILTNLNLILPEEGKRRPVSPSVSQHLGFIYRRDKHKYSHIFLHKPPNTSCTPCCQRLGGLSPACSDRIREIGFWKWHFCQQTVKTVTWQHSISWWLEKEERREDWDQILNCSTPIFYQCWHFRVFYIMSECGLKMRHWHCGSEGELWKTDSNVFQAFGLFRISKPNTDRPWYSI